MPICSSKFYALSQLEEEFQMNFNEFKEKFDSTTKQGEKFVFLIFYIITCI